MEFNAGKTVVFSFSRKINTLGIILGVKGGRRVRLTTLPPSKRRLSTNVEASTSHNTTGSPRPVTGIVLPFFSYDLYNSGTLCANYIEVLNIFPTPNSTAITRDWD
jgi:hypothetical protein